MRYAIIDIGYNAIRSVVYEDNEPGSAEIFNEKFKSDILSLLELDSLDVKHHAYLSLQYLARIFNLLSVTNIKCVATSVLRGHLKAEEFKKVVKEKFNFDIEILSGEQEAYLSALGMISGIGDACGVAADLGGGSLELAEISDKTIGMLKSIPLGTKMIAENNLNDIAILTEIIQKEFGSYTATGQNLYLIGGAFRFIGKHYMDFANYPVKILHNLEISKTDFAEFLEKLNTRHNSDNNNNRQLKNIDYNAVLLAQALLSVFSFEKIVISNYGLKEGVRFSNFSRNNQAKDLVYERVKTMIGIRDANVNFSKYAAIISNLLIEPDQFTYEIFELTFMLARFNKYIDRTLRADFMVEFILTTDIPFSHRQRLMIGGALTVCCGLKSNTYLNRIAKKIINKKDFLNSQIIGNFIKIVRLIDGPESQTPSFSLLLKNHYIEIDTVEILPRLIFEKICEYIKDIAFLRKGVK